MYAHHTWFRQPGHVGWGERATGLLCSLGCCAGIHEVCWGHVQVRVLAQPMAVVALSKRTHGALAPCT